MLYTITIMSVIEVLAVTVPVLLSVAYITIAERKTMASMQRRLGPNVVGCITLNLTHKRTFHYSCDASELYYNRKPPLLNFRIMCFLLLLIYLTHLLFYLSLNL